MDVLSPRERILKGVRQGLLQSKSQLGATDTIPLKSPAFQSHTPNIQSIVPSQKGQEFYLCKNKYHFLDRVLDFMQRKKIKNVTCINQRLNQYFSSCGVDTSPSDMGQKLVVADVDLFDSKGLFVAFNNQRKLPSLLAEEKFVAIVAFADALQSNSFVLFQKLKKKLFSEEFRSYPVFKVSQKTNAMFSKNVAVFVIQSR